MILEINLECSAVEALLLIQTRLMRPRSGNAIISIANVKMGRLYLQDLLDLILSMMQIHNRLRVCGDHGVRHYLLSKV